MAPPPQVYITPSTSSGLQPPSARRTSRLPSPLSQGMLFSRSSGMSYTDNTQSPQLQSTLNAQQQPQEIQASAPPQAHRQRHPPQVKPIRKQSSTRIVPDTLSTSPRSGVSVPVPSPQNSVVRSAKNLVTIGLRPSSTSIGTNPILIMVEVLIAAGVFVVTLLGADFAIENQKARRSVDYVREAGHM